MATQPLHYGGIHWIVATATAVVADTPIKAAGTTEGIGCNGFYPEGNNRLVCTAQVGRTYKILVTASLTKASGIASLSHVYVYKNGVQLPGEVGRTLSNSTDEGAFALACIADLKKGDYVECWIKLDTGDDVTIQSGTMVVECIG